MIKRAWRYLMEQPFVGSTGFAALVHSTWSLGTFFSGPQPASPGIGADINVWAVFFVQTLAWHIPALAIAFALDVGQIATSHDIREAVQRGIHPWRKYVTFAVFAVATYYLQWMYCAHHIPQLTLGSGVSSVHQQTTEVLRDAAIWIVPLFLPLSTLMYTFSHNAVQSKPHAEEIAVVQSAPVNVHIDALPAPRSVPTGNYTGEAGAAVAQVDGAYIFTCPDCKREVSYTNMKSAVKGAAAHLGRHCPVRHPKPVDMHNHAG